MYDPNDPLEARTYDTFSQQVASVNTENQILARAEHNPRPKIRRNFSTSSYTASIKPSTLSYDKTESGNYFPSYLNSNDNRSYGQNNCAESGLNEVRTSNYSLGSNYGQSDNHIHSIHQNQTPCLKSSFPTEVNHLDLFISDGILGSADKNVSPLITSSRQTQSSAMISSGVSSRRLAFLENLESIPTESDIFELRALTITIKASITDQSALISTLSLFGSRFDDISVRANYWGWAPKYFSFIYKILQGSHGTISNINVLSYCSMLLSRLACRMSEFDFDREPSIQRYFIKKVLPRLVEITGKYNTNFDTPSLAMMYICFYLNVDEHLVSFLINLRSNIPNFFTNKNNILRYRRAFWFASVCNRLLIQNDLNGGSAIIKEILFHCISEAQISYTQENELTIKSAYNKFFHFDKK